LFVENLKASRAMNRLSVISSKVLLQVPYLSQIDVLVASSVLPRVVFQEGAGQ
jgi:hypothetical protein